MIPKKSGRQSQSGRRPGRRTHAETDRDPTESESLFISLLCGPPLPMAPGLVSFPTTNRHSIAFRRPSPPQVKTLLPNRRGEVPRGLSSCYSGTGGTAATHSSADEETSLPRTPIGQSTNRTEADEVDELEVTLESTCAKIRALRPLHELQTIDKGWLNETNAPVPMSASRILARQHGPIQDTRTLEMPFLSAGMLNLAPGSEEWRENTGNLQIVFVVHRGKATVTINRKQFRISAGGMFFIPRGNLCSIINAGERQCQLFYSRACEVIRSKQDAFVARA